MKTLLLILACGANLVYSSQETEQANPPKEAVVSEDTKISMKNIDNPIIIDSKKIDNIEQLNNYIDDYLRKNHDGWNRTGRAMFNEDGKYVLWCMIANDEHRVITLVFDISPVVNRLLKSNKKDVREEINNYLDEFKPSSSSETSN